MTASSRCRSRRDGTNPGKLTYAPSLLNQWKSHNSILKFSVDLTRATDLRVASAVDHLRHTVICQAVAVHIRVLWNPCLPLNYLREIWWLENDSEIRRVCVNNTFNVAVMIFWSLFFCDSLDLRLTMLTSPRASPT